MECGFEFTIRGYDLEVMIKNNNCYLVKYVVYALYSYLTAAIGYFQVQ